MFYSKGWLTESTITIHKDPKTEPITTVSYCQGVVAWATKSDIKLRDLISKKKLGYMNKPEMPEGTPNVQVKLNNATPCIIFKQKRKNL